MRELTVCVPSRGRPFKVIFEHLKLLDPKLVYIYVHKPEYELYHTLYPEFNVIPHEEKGIGGIRMFMQKHQYDLGNDSLHLDDDVHAFCKFDEKVEEEFFISLPEFYDLVKEQTQKGEYDYIRFPLTCFAGYKPNEGTPDHPELPHICYAISTSLWDKGIRFSREMVSEDWGMAIEIMLHQDEVNILYMNNNVITNHIEDETHFGSKWWKILTATQYAKYGRIVRIELFGHDINGKFQPWHVKEYKEAGHPVYSRLSTKQLKMWQPLTEEEKKAREESLAVIEKNMKYHAKCCIESIPEKEYAEQLCAVEGVLSPAEKAEIEEEICLYAATETAQEQVENVSDTLKKWLAELEKMYKKNIGFQQNRIPARFLPKEKKKESEAQ